MDLVRCASAESSEAYCLLVGSSLLVASHYLVESSHTLKLAPAHSWDASLRADHHKAEVDHDIDSDAAGHLKVAHYAFD